ncbi:1896_t:CDS:2 [Acaulospora colombiana]|uniref:1896_t:CDS:1 n=1 Tax=Acaulospora colombiana TaxID=27376 RepID=A0ACA9KW84_9GLOM|nr:1896_t:CDS:2 [Acaulospora colombiana]
MVQTNVNVNENFNNNNLCLSEDLISITSSDSENDIISETSVLDGIQNHRDKAESHFTEGNYVKAIELWELILKDPRHTSEDRRCPTTRLTEFIEGLSQKLRNYSSLKTFGDLKEMLRRNKVNGEDITNIKQFTPVFEEIIKADDNDLTDLKEEDFCGGEVVIASVSSASQSKPAYDHSYFRNKILDQYHNLYRECSSENFDYYEITEVMMMKK